MLIDCEWVGHFKAEHSSIKFFLLNFIIFEICKWGAHRMFFFVHFGMLIWCLNLAHTYECERRGKYSCFVRFGFWIEIALLYRRLPTQKIWKKLQLTVHAYTNSSSNKMKAKQGRKKNGKWKIIVDRTARQNLTKDFEYNCRNESNNDAVNISLPHILTLIGWWRWCARSILFSPFRLVWCVFLAIRLVWMCCAVCHGKTQ